MSALRLKSARISKLRIPFLNHISDRGLCKKFFDFHIFYFFLFLITILSFTLILAVSQL